MTIDTIRRINELSAIIDAKNYLEIGVWKGQVFNSLSFDGTKVAVDPRFKFDTQQYSSSKVLFYSTKSDKFFNGFRQDIKFDIVYLDGLHTYEQTFADLCNSLCFCRPESLILIDDTLPSDMYSSLRSQELCYEARRWSVQDNLEVSQKWHGDTYKVLYLINHYLRSYDYSTIVKSGNPQTVIWKRSLFNPEHKPPFKRFDNRELLHSLTENLGSINYIKTMESYGNIYNLSVEEDLFKYLREARK